MRIVGFALLLSCSVSFHLACDSFLLASNRDAAVRHGSVYCTARARGDSPVLAKRAHLAYFEL